MIQITNDGLYYTPFGVASLREEIEIEIYEEYGDDISEEEFIRTTEEQFAKRKKFIPDSAFPECLCDVVEINHNVKFKRILGLIFQHKDIFNIVFKSALSNTKLDDFIEDFKSPPTLEKKSIELIVFWFCIYEAFGEDEDDFFDMIHEIPTFASTTSDPVVDSNAVTFVASFASLGTLKEYLFYLECSIKFHNHIQDFMNNEESDEDAEIFSVDFKAFTLFDMLYAIIHEISSHGVPAKRDEARENLEQKLKILSNSLAKKGVINIDAQELNDPSNPTQLKSLTVEELKKQQDEAASNDDFKRAAEIRDIIKKKKKK